jgi:hypothetical protein
VCSLISSISYQSHLQSPSIMMLQHSSQHQLLSTVEYLSPNSSSQVSPVTSIQQKLLLVLSSQKTNQPQQQPLSKLVKLPFLISTRLKPIPLKYYSTFLALIQIQQQFPLLRLTLLMLVILTLLPAIQNQQLLKLISQIKNSQSHKQLSTHGLSQSS